MRKFLFASVLSFMPVIAFASTPSFNTENIVASDTDWGVINASVNNNQACILMQSFPDNTGMFSILDLANSDSIGITIINDNWAIKSSDLIKIQIDDFSIYSAHPLVQNNSTFGFIIPTNMIDNFMKELVSGKNIKLTDGKKVYNIPLINTPKSVAALIACDATYIDPIPSTPSPSPSPQIIPDSSSGKIQI